MDEQIVQATIRALGSINQARFFQSERGYQGELLCTLRTLLGEHQVLNGNTILEEEYQKSARHHTSQRPDTILHIPTEASGATVDENNLAVWALKRRASAVEARDDFGKLDEMFECLRYPLGIFINIDSAQHHLGHYTGDYPDRLVAFAVRLDDGNVSVKQASIVHGQVIENEID